jgi:hypothetical protein
MSEKNEWTNDEFFSEKHPRDFQLRSYQAEAMGPYGHIVIVMGATGNDGKFYLCGRPTWRSTEGVATADEFLSLPKDQAQQLFDALWEGGLRPTPDPVLRRLGQVEMTLGRIINWMAGNLMTPDVADLMIRTLEGKDKEERDGK